MELVVVMAVVALAVVLVVSLACLSFLVHQKLRTKSYTVFDDRDQQLRGDSEPTVSTSGSAADVDASSGVCSGFELSYIGRNLSRALENGIWFRHASDLAPHCLQVLRSCHVLTERLLESVTRLEVSSPVILRHVQRVGPRVDDVIASLYPPLDPRLVEARCSAMVLALSHLVLVTKLALPSDVTSGWMDKLMEQIEEEMDTLSEVSQQQNPF